MKTRDQVEAIARDYGQALGATDFPINRLVLIRHADGTQILFRFAFLLRHDDWVVVFTEHNGIHCFAIETLDEFAQFVEDTEIGTL